MDGEPDPAGGSRGGWTRAHIASFALFGLVTLALLAAVGVIVSTLEAERTVRAQVSRTNDVLRALRGIDHAAINAESGQRGYLITLDRAYLAPYRLGTRRYPQAIGELRRLLGDRATPRQRRLADRVERLADARFAEMAHSVALLDGGEIVEAEYALRTDEGQRLMVRLRAAIDQLEAIERQSLAREIGDTGLLEARIVPLLGALLAIVVGALALGLWQFVRAARGEAAAGQAQALREARDRADLLARELNHRVKNLFAVILAIVRMSGKDVPAARPVIDRISERIRALVRAHDITQGAPGHGAVDLRELIETAIAPYRSDSARCAIDGEPLALSTETAMPLGLVVHELVTNAVKHGALGKPGRGGPGRLDPARRAGADRVARAGLVAAAGGRPRGLRQRADARRGAPAERNDRADHRRGRGGRADRLPAGKRLTRRRPAVRAGRGRSATGRWLSCA